MRVLMLSWEYPPDIAGGIGTHVAGLAPALVRAGVQVHVITPKPFRGGDLIPESANLPGMVSEVTPEGVVVHRVPLAPDGRDIYEQAIKTNQVMQAAGHMLLGNNPGFDLIHAHDWLVGFAAQALSSQLHLALITTMHATERGRARGGELYTDLQRNIHNAEAQLVKVTSRVITCSQYMASEVSSFFQTLPQKIDVVPNGVELYDGKESTPEDLDGCRARYAALDQRIVFGVGRLVHEKGFHVLVEAAPTVLSEFPNTRFVIAGTGPEATNLTRQANILGVGDHIRFPGRISNAERDLLYQAAACAVFPSLYEPFGIVALEAMAAGCPVVVTEIGGLREVVRHGETGVTIYPNDVHSLAWGVLHVLHNPDMAAARAKEARQVVSRDFNWDTIAARTLSIYRKVIAEHQQIAWNYA